jgi:transglycosylase-like protein with SLT domain
MGLMQLMPETARRLAVTDPWDAEQNLSGGTAYLRQLLDQFDGRVELALAGYNAGPGAVARYGGVPPYAETREYVRRIVGMVDGPDAAMDAATVRLGRQVFLQRDPGNRIRLTTDAPR